MRTMKKKKTTGNEDILTNVTAADILASCGVFLTHMADAIQNTDALYGDTFINDFADEMRMHALMLAAVVETYPFVSKKMKLDVPDGVAVVRIPNPFYEKHTKDNPHKGGVPDLDLGDLPF